MPTTIHLIGNAHIDPVWLWDWREGLNESISTCRTMVELLREYPEARFIRGEAAVYEYIERYDPALFSAIRRLVQARRWDVVGGNYIQPDTNLPATESLLRQFIRGKRYFRERFGVEVTAAWAADSFGHAAGLPEILHAAGFDSFAFTRPSVKVLPFTKPAFWWRSASGARILAYRPDDGWYASERGDLSQRLDSVLNSAQACELENIAMFYGLGDHGGGTTRQHLHLIRDWAGKHPDVSVLHTGLHDYFASLRAELKLRGDDFLPTHEGELNFCLRGCSASVAKFKFRYRRAEADLQTAERTAAVLAAVLRRQPRSLASAWDVLLFNAFHDILPGSCIERAVEDQLAQVQAVTQEAQRAASDSLLALALQITTQAKDWPLTKDQPTPVPVLIWNAHPWRVKTHVEMEVSLDYRPLWQYDQRPERVPVVVRDGAGRLCAHQTIAEEHDSLRGLPWRRRVVVPMDLPPLGWTVLNVGLDPTGKRRRHSTRVCQIDEHTITNGLLQVRATPGDEAVTFVHRGRPWLDSGLAFQVYDDPWGAWGGMTEEKDSFLLRILRERWRIESARVLETGPQRAAIWIRFAGARSWIELTLSLAHRDRRVRACARVLWNERSSRLKLVLPVGGSADYDVPGAVVRREPCGEVPGGRWVRAGSGANQFGFASDALYGFDTTETEFHATIVRGTRYASDVPRPADDTPWLPASDIGELKFAFLLTPEIRSLRRWAAELESPPAVMPVPAGVGPLPAIGSLMSELPFDVQLLALSWRNDEEIECRLHHTGAAARELTATWLEQQIRFGRLNPGEISNWRLVRHGRRWKATRSPVC